MNTISVWRLLAVVGFVLIVINPAAAQQATTSQASIDHDLFTYFYNDPQTARLLGFLERNEKRAQGWEPFPPVAGFFAVVFGRHSDWIDRLIPAHPDPRTAVAIAAALRLSGCQSGHHRQHSAVGLAAIDGNLRSNAGDQDLIQFPRGVHS